MATYERKLVHKQFNSPIGLYSENNVKATLNRELKVLSNGNVGIDFDDSSKPTNLANSAVLRMLEEEEQEKRQRQSGIKKVVWPPERSPSVTRSSSQPPRVRPSPVRDESHYQESQSQYPNQYYQNTSQRQPSLLRSQDPYLNHVQQVPFQPHQQQQQQQQQQPQQHQQQPLLDQQHQQQQQQQQQQPYQDDVQHYQQTYDQPQYHSQQQIHQQHEQADGQYGEQQQQQQPLPSATKQIDATQNARSRSTPVRTFRNPDPSYLHINTPGYFRACQQQQPQQQHQSRRSKSPCTVAFAGGVAKQQQQQQQQHQQQQHYHQPALLIASDPRSKSPSVNPYINQSHQQNHQPYRSTVSTERYSSEQQLQQLQHKQYHQSISLPSSAYQQQPQQSQQQLNYIVPSRSPVSPSGWSPVKPPQISNNNICPAPASSIQNYTNIDNNSNINNYNHHPPPHHHPHPNQQTLYETGTGQLHGDYIQYQQQGGNEYQEQVQQPHPQQQYQDSVPFQQQQQQPPFFEQQQQQQQPQSFYRQPSPGIITLREKAPIHQPSPPVFTSQPAAASFGGGANMRGDQKWPPEEYKKQSDIDNDSRRKLASEPAFRPRRIQKDYTEFFNQHALNATYTSYRAPPGTQHHSGQ